jgi:hypothetical protein
MSKTKIIGYLIVVLAVLKMAVDLLDGNGFDLNLHFNEIAAALGGAGLVFLRSAVDKVTPK